MCVVYLDFVTLLFVVCILLWVDVVVGVYYRYGTRVVNTVLPLAIRTGICRCLMSTSPTNNVILFVGFDQKRTLWYRYDSIAEPEYNISLLKREIERIQANQYERDIGQQNEEKMKIHGCIIY